MTVQRKTSPDPVQWDQQAILSAIARVGATFGQLTYLTGNPPSDTRAPAMRNVRDEEIINALVAIPEVLERIHSQLSLLTGVTLEPGDTI